MICFTRVEIRYSEVLVSSLLIYLGTRFHKHFINIMNPSFSDELIFYAFKINLILCLSMLHSIILKDTVAFGLELYLSFFITIFYINFYRHATIEPSRAVYLWAMDWSSSLVMACIDLRSVCS